MKLLLVLGLCAFAAVESSDPSQTEVPGQSPFGGGIGDLFDKIRKFAESEAYAKIKAEIQAAANKTVECYETKAKLKEQDESSQRLHELIQKAFADDQGDDGMGRFARLLEKIQHLQEYMKNDPEFQKELQTQDELYTGNLEAASQCIRENMSPLREKIRDMLKQLFGGVPSTT